MACRAILAEDVVVQVLLEQRRVGREILAVTRVSVRRCGQHDLPTAGNTDTDPVLDPCRHDRCADVRIGLPAVA